MTAVETSSYIQKRIWKSSILLGGGGDFIMWVKSDTYYYFIFYDFFLLTQLAQGTPIHSTNLIGQKSLMGRSIHRPSSDPPLVRYKTYICKAQGKKAFLYVNNIIYVCNHKYYFFIINVLLKIFIHIFSLRDTV